LIIRASVRSVSAWLFLSHCSIIVMLLGPALANYDWWWWWWWRWYSNPCGSESVQHLYRAGVVPVRSLYHREWVRDNRKRLGRAVCAHAPRDVSRSRAAGHDADVTDLYANLPANAKQIVEIADQDIAGHVGWGGIFLLPVPIRSSRLQPVWLSAVAEPRYAARVLRIQVYTVHTLAICCLLYNTRRNRLCRAIDSTYCYTFLRSVSVCRLSSVTLVHFASTVRRIYIPFGRYSSAVQRHIVLDGGPWPPRERTGIWRVKVPFCHLAYANEELDKLARAIPPFAKLIWSFCFTQSIAVMS